MPVQKLITQDIVLCVQYQRLMTDTPTPPERSQVNTSLYPAWPRDWMGPRERSKAAMNNAGHPRDFFRQEGQPIYK